MFYWCTFCPRIIFHQPKSSLPLWANNKWLCWQFVCPPVFPKNWKFFRWFISRAAFIFLLKFFLMIAYSWCHDFVLELEHDWFYWHSECRQCGSWCSMGRRKKCVPHECRTQGSKILQCNVLSFYNQIYMFFNWQASPSAAVNNQAALLNDIWPKVLVVLFCFF